jgi:hypothetical protein
MVVPSAHWRHTLKRRTFDIAVPIVYGLAVLLAILLGNATGVGGVAVIGALCLVVYYAQLRQNLKA